MKRTAWMIAAALGLFLGSGIAQAGWAQAGSFGYQPCWGMFTHRDKATPASRDPRRGMGQYDQLGMPMNPYVPNSRYIPSPINPVMQFMVPRTEIPESRILLVDGPGGY